MAARVMCLAGLMTLLALAGRANVIGAMARTGPAADDSPAPAAGVSRARYLMGTVCEGTAHGDGAGAALEAAFDEIARLESVLSDYRPDSELSRLNRTAAAAPVRCSADLFGMIAASVRFSAGTGGAFDITVAPLVAAWDLRGAGRAPARADLARARRAVGWEKLRLDPRDRSVRFGAAGMAIDPGAIGKGIALDAAARVLRERGVDSALLDFGGQILALGAPPGAAAWEVEIADPARRDRAAVTLSLRDASASTSGNAERHVTVAGRRLGHIIDPRSGRPTQSAGSVTVVARTGAEADALSTALFVMGRKEGLRWAEGRRDLTAIFLDAGRGGAIRLARAGGFIGSNPVRAVRAGDHRRGETDAR